MGKQVLNKIKTTCGGCEYVGYFDRYKVALVPSGMISLLVCPRCGTIKKQ